MTLAHPSTSDLRISVAMYGDVDRDPGSATKYGLLLDELRTRARVGSVFDAAPRGFRRLVLGARTFRRNRAEWRERFYKDPSSFAMQTAALRLAFEPGSAGQDALLQIGALFDGTATGVPVTIYTDYTAAMSARRPAAGRSPFSTAEVAKRLTHERGLYLRASAICTRSAEAAASIRDDYGVAQDRLSVVGGGVNFAPLPPERESRTRGEPTLLFIGKDFHRKGGDRVLSAFSVARRRLGRGRLIMVTDARAIGDLAADAVTFIQPSWDRSFISSLYAGADVLVSASRLETWGDVVLEAMSHGLPVIGMRDQPMAEIIEDGANGCLADPGDPRSLAGHMISLLESEPLRRRLGRAARVTIERKYTWGNVAERILAETAKRLPSTPTSKAIISNGRARGA